MTERQTTKPYTVLNIQTDRQTHTVVNVQTDRQTSHSVKHIDLQTNLTVSNMLSERQPIVTHIK